MEGSGSGGSEKTTDYLRIIQPGDNGTTINVSPDHWEAFMTVLRRDECKSLFESAEHGAQEVYTGLLNLTPVAAGS